MIRRALSGLLLAALAGAALPAACILDLDNLTSGGSGGAATTSSSSGSGGASASSSSASTTATGTTSSSTGGDPDAGDAGDAPSSCPLLDCSCVGGPTMIAAGAPFADSPRGIFVDGDGLFWVDEQGGAVVYAPQTTGAPQKLAPGSSPRAIVVSGDAVVWTAQQGLFTCTRTSCAGSAHLLYGAAAPGSVRDVAFDGQTVVWTDHGSGTNTGKVLSCAIGSCGPIELHNGMVAPEGVTFHGTAAFWVDQGNGNSNGNVARSPKTTASLTQLAAALNLPTGIAVDDTYVYWTEQAPGGHVYRCAYGGGYCDNPEDTAPAAGGLGRPRDIHIGGGRIYWTNTDDGTIVSCPQPGCGAAQPKVHVSGRTGLQRLAVGSSCLFWTEDGGGGAVLKVAR